MVVGAAGVLDVAEAVASVAAAAIGGPDEVLLVEIFEAAAVAPSSLSTLTCANCTVRCAAFRCLLKFEVLPPCTNKSIARRKYCTWLWWLKFHQSGSKSHLFSFHSFS